MSPARHTMSSALLSVMRDGRRRTLAQMCDEVSAIVGYRVSQTGLSARWRDPMSDDYPVVSDRAPGYQRLRARYVRHTEPTCRGSFEYVYWLELRARQLEFEEVNA